MKLLLSSIIALAVFSCTSAKADDCYVNKQYNCNMFVQDTYTDCGEDPETADPTESPCFLTGYNSSCGDKYTSNGSNFWNIDIGNDSTSRRGNIDTNTLHYCGQHYRCKCTIDAGTLITTYLCEQYPGSINMYVAIFAPYGDYCNPYGY